MDEKTACYVLINTEGLGPVAIKAMKAAAGSYSACLDERPGAFADAGILSKKQALSLEKNLRLMDSLISEYMKYTEDGMKILIMDDAEYPERLRNIENAPPMLFVKGILPRSDLPSAAIIGARNCSEYGLAATRFFASELAKNNVQIISGMAYGIDGAAGEAALHAGGYSFAVLGSGINVCYPKENYRLYRELSGYVREYSGRGGVISEQHPLSEALPKHFVARNRIISGLCDVLIVIEARERSGTSITVGCALEQGKDIFALPGRITDPLGRGCNRLLRDGAIPLTEPGDILAYLGVDADAGRCIKKPDPSALTVSERSVYDHVSEDATHIDDIVRGCGMGVADTLTMLYSLENKGYVVNTASAYYCRRLG